MKNNKKNKKGFTLIEMLAAVVILGILAAIATIVISRLINNSRKTTFFGSYDNIITELRSDAMMGSIKTDTDSETNNDTNRSQYYNYDSNAYSLSVKKGTGSSTPELCNISGDTHNGQSGWYNPASGTVCVNDVSAAKKIVSGSCNFYRIVFASKSINGAASGESRKPSYTDGNTDANGKMTLTTYMDNDGVAQSTLPSGCSY